MWAAEVAYLQTLREGVVGEVQAALQQLQPCMPAALSHNSKGASKASTAAPGTLTDITSEFCPFTAAVDMSPDVCLGFLEHLCCLGTGGSDCIAAPAKCTLPSLPLLDCPVPCLSRPCNTKVCL